MRRRILAGASITALCLTTIVGSPVAASTKHVFPENQELEATKTLASGVLRDSKGNTISGAELKVYAFPQNLPENEGESFSLQEIGSGESDSKGEYSITPDYSVLRDALKQSDEAWTPVNVTIVASAPRHETALATTVWVASDGSRAVINSADLEDASTDSPSISMATANAEGKDLVAKIDLALDSRSSSFVKQNDFEVSEPAAAGCTTKATYAKRLVTVGQVSSTSSSGFNATFKFSTSSSTTLGVGLSNSGAYGTFNASGTSSVTSSSSTTYPAVSSATSRFMRSYFNYAKYQCSYGTVNPVVRHEMRSSGFAGGATTLAATTPNAPHCVTYSNGSTFVKDSTTAATFSIGAKTKTAIGIDLSSRSGYTNKTSVTVKFTANRKLCGSHDHPGGTPRLLVVKN